MYLVVGFGATGISVIKYLNKTNIVPFVADTNLEFSKLQALVADHDFDCAPTALQAELLNKVTVIVISPGVPLTLDFIVQAKKQGVEVIGDVELFARALADIDSPPRLIGVTGSNGKTTVVTLITECLQRTGVRAVAAGNIGMCVLDVLERINDYNYIVLELSSFQLDSTSSLRCDLACIVNITPDHMDRYQDFAAYRASKLTIFKLAQAAIINLYDKQQADLPIKADFYLGAEREYNNIYMTDNKIVLNKQELAVANDFALQGEHHYYNFMLVIAVLRYFDCDLKAPLSFLYNFKGLEHRCQHVATVRQVKYFNDSKATNVAATIAAVNSFAASWENLILIAGGDAKDADLKELSPILAQLKAVILFGKDKYRLADLVAEPLVVDSMQEAVALAASLAVADTAVLLSPACSSLDMYKNFTHRGSDFIKQVRSL